MQLQPLYQVRFHYTDNWYIQHGAPQSVEGETFGLIEGSCEGEISGRLRGANHGHWRSDNTFLPDFQGVIETTDGAVIYADYRGYSRATALGERAIVATATHLSQDARYSWLNQTLCVGVGTVQNGATGRSELVVDWCNVVWESLA